VGACWPDPKDANIAIPTASRDAKENGRTKYLLDRDKISILISKRRPNIHRISGISSATLPQFKFCPDTPSERGRPAADAAREVNDGQGYKLVGVRPICILAARQFRLTPDDHYFGGWNNGA